MSHDIFISYSRKDKDTVDTIVEKLKEQGFSVWIDTYGIESGEAFRGIIVDAIENAEIVLFFSSEASNSSEWTKKEIALAVSSKKYVIPIKLDTSKYNRSIRLDLIDLDYIDLTNPQNQKPYLDRLYRTIRKRLGIEDSVSKFSFSEESNREYPIPESGDQSFIKRYLQKVGKDWKERNICINILLCILIGLSMVGAWIGGIYLGPSLIGLIGVILLLVNQSNGITFIVVACFIWILANALHSTSTGHKFFLSVGFLRAWFPLCVTLLTSTSFLLKKNGIRWSQKCNHVSSLSIIILTIVSMGWLGSIFYDLIVTKNGLSFNMRYILSNIRSFLHT